LLHSAALGTGRSSRRCCFARRWGPDGLPGAAPPLSSGCGVAPQPPLVCHLAARLREQRTKEFEALAATIPEVPERIPRVPLPEVQASIRRGHGEPDLDPEGERLASAWARERFGSECRLRGCSAAPAGLFVTHCRAFRAAGNARGLRCGEETLLHPAAGLLRSPRWDGGPRSPRPDAELRSALPRMARAFPPGEAGMRGDGRSLPGGSGSTASRTTRRSCKRRGSIPRPTTSTGAHSPRRARRQHAPPGGGNAPAWRPSVTACRRTEVLGPDWDD
jgi:hypothetical protein